MAFWPFVTPLTPARLEWQESNLQSALHIFLRDLAAGVRAFAAGFGAGAAVVVFVLLAFLSAYITGDCAHAAEFHL